MSKVRFKSNVAVSEKSKDLTEYHVAASEYDVALNLKPDLGHLTLETLDLVKSKRTG